MKEEKVAKVSLLGLNNILVDSLKTNSGYAKFFEETGIKTYQDIENLVNNGVITDSFIISSLEDVKAKQDIKLKDVSTEALKINKRAALILETYGIRTFADLGIYIGNSLPDVVNDMYLMNAFNIIAKTLAENSKKKAR